jgi:hypothetical protein
MEQHFKTDVFWEFNKKYQAFDEITGELLGEYNPNTGAIWYKYV